MMQVSIGIDASLSNTALCFYLPTQGTLPHTECRKAGAATKGLRRIDRYLQLVSAISLLCHEANPEVVCLEGYSYASQGRAVLTMTEFGGLLRGALRQWYVIEVPPSTLKLWATGKGNANKTLVVASLTKRYGVEYATDDEYDAFALARIGAQLMNWEPCSVGHQARAIEKLREN